MTSAAIFQRFQLTPNTLAIGREKAFMLYDLLIIPFFVGVLLLIGLNFNWMYSLSLLALFAIVLLNIHFYYRNTYFRDRLLFLGFRGSDLIIKSGEEIFFRAKIEHITIEWLRHEKSDCLIARLTGGDSNEDIRIGLKGHEKDLSIATRPCLHPPGYWMNKKESTAFLGVLLAFEKLNDHK